MGKGLLLECNGESLTISEWSARSGISCATIWGRFRCGWSAEEAIFTAVLTQEEKVIRRNGFAKKRRAANPDAEKAKLERWHKENPDRKKQISHKYLDKHRDRLNAVARSKNRLPERREYMRAYATKHRRDNPHLYTTYSNTRRARALAADGLFTNDEWLALLAERCGCCGYCGDGFGSMHRDHRIPLSRGGSNHISNIIPACGSCNSSKGSLTEDEFRRRLAGEAQGLDERWAAQLAKAQTAGRASRWANGQ